MELNPSHWSALFESVKSDIPSIDSDYSTSDDEEDIAVFRRPTPALVLKDTEDLEKYLSASSKDTELEDVPRSWTEETFCNQGKLADETVGACEVSDTAQRGSPQAPSPTHTKADGLHIQNAIRNSAPIERHPFCRSPETEDHSTTQRQYTSVSTSPCLSQKDAYGSVTLETVGTLPKSGREPSIPKKCWENGQPEGFPVLSFTPLEHWDLDLVLQTLKKDGVSFRGAMSDAPIEAHSDGDMGRSQGSLMEKLEAFCNKQSCGDNVKEETFIKNDATTQIKHVQYPFRQKSGWGKSFETTAAELQLSHRQSPTVYIDLRCPEPSSITKGCTATPGSSRKLSDPVPREMASPPGQDPHSSRPSGSVSGRGEITGKSMLLQKLREAKTHKSLPDGTCSQLVDSAGVHLGGEQCRETFARHTAALKKSVPATPGDQDRSSPSAQQSAATKQPTHPNEQQQKQQSKQKSQHKLHQQLLNNMERHRPQRSVNDREPAAERTDVLFHSEASYLQSVNTLPTDIKNMECLVLTVNLSSLGVVAGNSSNGKAQTVESAATKSHTYNALVAWFLSLVGPGPGREDKAGVEVPFWVAGLQQLWREDALALHVLAVSHEEESPSPCPKPRRRGVDKGRSAFHRLVLKFLSQTSLRAAAHWLPELRTLLELHACPSDVHVPTSSLDRFVSVHSDKATVEQTFGSSPGFYWQTVENPDPVCQRPEAVCSEQLHTEPAVALGYQTLFLQPLVTHHTLQLVLRSGLDLCGLRLLYPPAGLLPGAAGGVPPCSHDDGAVSQPVLALALRGPDARAAWQDVTGPADPALARRTDPASINAVHCGGRDRPLFSSAPRLDTRVHADLCLWFAGRAPGDESPNPERAPTPSDRADPSDPSDTEKSTSPWYLTRSPATLCATVKAHVFLVASPRVAPRGYAWVLSACARRGFGLAGIQRLQLSHKRALAMGLTSQQASWFSGPASAAVLDEAPPSSPEAPPPHCLVLLLARENALRHCASLPAALMEGCVKEGLVCVSSRLSDDRTVDPGCCFHVLPYSESLLCSFGRCMWAVPEPCRVVLSNHRCPSSPELEQVVVVTLSGTDMSRGLSLLHRALMRDPAGRAEEQGGFELLALKWLPGLSRQQARDVSPFEVGDPRWQSSLGGLQATPALVGVLRRVDAFAALRRLLLLLLLPLRDDPGGKLKVLMSPTPDLAYRQVLLFFSEEEIIPDHSVRQLLKFLPPPCINTPGSKCEPFLSGMVQGPQLLVTLCLFKPGVWSHAVGKILHKVHQSGFTLVGLRVLVLDTHTATTLVSGDKDPSAVEEQVRYLCSGPSLALCLQRENAVKRLLDLLGPEDQDQARAQDQFLWRACYGADRPHSGIYGSGSYQRAVWDVKLMFPEGLCCAETDLMRQEQMPCVRSDSLACVVREHSHTLASVTKETALLSVLASVQNGESLVRSALCQTTCLLMPCDAARPSQAPPHHLAPPPRQLAPPPRHLALLGLLLRTGCHLEAGRMSVLDEAQRRHVDETLAPPSGGDGRIPRLSEGPCLILALQRDNVVTCFDLMLQRIYRDRPDLEQVGKGMVYPSTEKEAGRLLCYLFDGLSPDSRHAIVSR